MFFSGTKIGGVVGRMTALSVTDVEEVAYNDSVLSQMADLNTEKQMYNEGVLSDGTTIGEYSQITIEHYKPLAMLDGRDGKTDHITLKDTGETYSNINYFYRSGGLLVDYVDMYGLAQIYGVFAGLTAESKDQLKPEIKENVIDLILAQR